MGLKEEMTADIDAQAPLKAEMTTRKTPAKKADPNAAPAHNHGNGRCEEQWIDEDGRRRTRPAQGRIPSYVFNCKACIAEDKKRMADAPEITEADVEDTVFLVPERAYDANVVRAYLAKRYPGMELFAVSDIRPAKLALHKGAKVVVVTRRILPGNATLGPSIIKTEDRHGSTIDVPVDPAKYIDEVVESAPVVVAECVTSTATSMFSDASVDMSEFHARLSDLAAPTYQIAQYQRIVGSNEVVFTMRALTV